MFQLFYSKYSFLSGFAKKIKSISIIIYGFFKKYNQACQNINTNLFKFDLTKI